MFTLQEKVGEHSLVVFVSFCVGIIATVTAILFACCKPYRRKTHTPYSEYQSEYTQCIPNSPSGNSFHNYCESGPSPSTTIENNSLISDRSYEINKQASTLYTIDESHELPEILVDMPSYYEDDIFSDNDCI